MATRISELKRDDGRGGYGDLDDRLLVLDFQAGDPEAFVEIHRRYVALSRYVCLRILNDRDDADEAVQETWIRVFRGLHNFNGRYALQPWISKIATNVAVDATRSKARRPQLADTPVYALDEETQDHLGLQPEETVERRFDIDLVHQVLSSIPVHHRRALMLREFEGRSHEEIGAELGVTPAQAKALIHRAKKSFRAAWEKAGGPMVLRALAVPFLLPGKLFEHVKRLVDRAQEAGQAALTQASDTTAQIVSTAAAPAATHVSERLVAGAVTLLVAGSVTAGVVVNRHRTHDPVERAEPAVVAPSISAPSPSVPNAGEAKAQVKAKTTEPGKDRQTHTARNKPGAIPPVEEPTPQTSVSPTPTPDPTPSGTPSPDPSPTGVAIPPAPAWTFAFTSSTTSIAPCSECDVPFELMASELEGDPAGQFHFEQEIKGVATDASGDPRWPFYLQVSGAADQHLGRIEYKFVLSSPAGPRWYEGVAYLTTRTDGQDGSLSLAFEGTFELRSDQEALAGMPEAGNLTATFDIWPDGTIYGGSVALTDPV